MNALIDVRFLQREWLWALPALFILGSALWFWCGREFHRRLGLIIAARLRTAQLTNRALLFRRLRLLLLILTLMALCIALARPLKGSQPKVASRQGVHLLIALDGSRSMLAQDVAPDRFTLAQKGIDSLLDTLSGDRAGLMLFAGQPTLVSPLTFDTVSLQLINRGLSVELAGKGGSSTSAAIKRGVEFFRKKRHVSKALVIFTDGEETEGDTVVAAQEAYQKDGVRVFLIGVGTAGGALIPRFERNSQRQRVRVGTVRDLQGKDVRSRLQEQLLRNAAIVAGGTYVDLNEAQGDLHAFYQQSLKPLAAPMEDVTLQDLRECSHVPLAVALALLILELLLPLRRSRAARPAIAALFAILLGLAPVNLRAAATEAQRLLAEHKFDEAFALLQQDLLAAPEDPLARYNYAIGAYAAGKYSVAIETFEKLSASMQSEVDTRSRMQLGNSLYRLGEQMAVNNPEGTVVQWEKSLAAYEAVQQIPAATHNLAKVSGELLELLRKLGRTKDREGNSAARVTPDQGIPAWRTALAYFDKAVQLVGEQPQAKDVSAQRRSVATKIYNAYFDMAEDKSRRAEYQHYMALELALDQMQEAISNYDEALAVKPGDARAEAGKRAASRTSEPWLIELADRQYNEGLEQRTGFLDNAIANWHKAVGNYNNVLERNAANEAAQRGLQKTNRALHDGYVALGDRKQKRAARGALTTQEKDVLLEQALEHYRAALNLEPDNLQTQDKLIQLGRKLTGLFVARGQSELAAGHKLAPAKPPEAIAWLERSVQSFVKALYFERANVAARTGKQAAEDLLRKLRDMDARNQRRIIGESKQLNDAKDMEDPGKKALKLLDYDTDKLASKKPQDYTAPEDLSVKDW